MSKIVIYEQLIFIWGPKAFVSNKKLRKKNSYETWNLSLKKKNKILKTKKRSNEMGYQNICPSLLSIPSRFTLHLRTVQYPFSSSFIISLFSLLHVSKSNHHISCVKVYTCMPSIAIHLMHGCIPYHNHHHQCWIWNIEFTNEREKEFR